MKQATKGLVTRSLLQNGYLNTENRYPRIDIRHKTVTFAIGKYWLTFDLVRSGGWRPGSNDIALSPDDFWKLYFKLAEVQEALS